LDIRDATIVGGRRGIYAHGFPDCGSLTLSSSILRDQTVASVTWDVHETCGVDLRGTNQLSVVSGYALEDLRNDVPFEASILANGITLNGRTYTGTVVGPADVPPDYRIQFGDGRIEF